MRLFHSTIVVAAVVCAANAFAAPSKMAQADTNRDGALSRAEACAGRTPHICKNFDRYDANRDGAVTRAEIRAYNNARRAAKGLPPKR
jgi:EF hand